MQHVPEGVIQAPESPDAPEALPGCRSISDDDLCAWCTRLLYRPGEISLCRLSILFNAMNGNRAEMSPEAAGIAACLMTYSHHACRTECYAMTVHYYRLRDYALQHPECSAIMRIID